MVGCSCRNKDCNELVGVCSVDGCGKPAFGYCGEDSFNGEKGPFQICCWWYPCGKLLCEDHLRVFENTSNRHTRFVTCCNQGECAKNFDKYMRLMRILVLGPFFVAFFSCTISIVFDC